jgi:hypothetical protein
MDENQTPGVRKKRTSITVRQQSAIDVLLIGGNDQQAADKAGVSRSTVTKWRNNPGSVFAEEFDRQREEMRKRQGARLVAAGSLATRALEDSVKDARSPSVRVSAARAILVHGLKANDNEELETSKLEIIFERLKVGLDRFEYQRAMEALLDDRADSGARRYPHLERLAERRLESIYREPVPDSLRLTQGGGVIVLPVKETESTEAPAVSDGDSAC